MSYFTPPSSLEPSTTATQSSSGPSAGTGRRENEFTLPPLGLSPLSPRASKHCELGALGGGDFAAPEGSGLQSPPLGAANSLLLLPKPLRWKLRVAVEDVLPFLRLGACEPLPLAAAKPPPPRAPSWKLLVVVAHKEWKMFSTLVRRVYNTSDTYSLPLEQQYLKTVFLRNKYRRKKLPGCCISILMGAGARGR